MYEEFTIQQGDTTLDDEVEVQAFADFLLNKVDGYLAKNAIEDSNTTISFSPIEQFNEVIIVKALATFKSEKSSGLDEIPRIVI